MAPPRKPSRRRDDEVPQPGPREFDLELPTNEPEEQGGGYARRRKPTERPQVPTFDLPNRGG